MGEVLLIIVVARDKSLGWRFMGFKTWCKARDKMRALMVRNIKRRAH